MDFFNTTYNLPKIPVYGTISVSLYILLAIFILAIIVMLLNIKIQLPPLIPRKISVYASSYKYWSPSGEFNNLILKDAIVLPENTYTATIESILYNTRNYSSTEGPYRHIAHRGSNDLIDSNPPQFGLPKRLNPGIFLDPNVNDILIFIDTVDGAQNYRESVRIADIPLDTPFRIGIVLKGKVLEVYYNCGLEVTKLLKGEPRNVENKWYGLAGSASMDGQIQNLYLWDKALAADDIRTLCPSLPTFSKKRPSCPNNTIPQFPNNQNNLTV